MATYGGKCPGCGQGVAIDAAFGKKVQCPACGIAVRLAQVKGTYSDEIGCDDRCMYARAPSCTCACAGEGHFLGWQVDLTSGQYAQPVPDKIVLKVARSQEQIKARAAAKVAAAAQAISDQQAAFAAQHQDVYALLTGLTDDSNYFLHDLARTLEEKGSLSERACEIALKIQGEDAVRAASEAAQALVEHRYAGAEGQKGVTVKGVVKINLSVAGYAYNTYDRFVIIEGIGDDLGVTVKIKGSAMFLYDINKGDTVEVTGTVKAHEIYEGVPQTVLIRPKGAVLEGAVSA